MKPSIKRVWAVRGVFACFLLAGCPDVQTPGPRYTGPTDSIDKVIAGINANNLRLPSLWVRHYFEATIVDPEKHTSNFVNGDGILLYRAPRDLRIVAKKELTDLFEIGSDDQQYWLKVVPQLDTLWWGNYRNVGKPCEKAVPIHPDLIVDVLGVGPIDTNLLRQPVPVMRYNNDTDQYMFIWSALSDDRWLPIREIWYDRATLLPQRVLLFDATGRVVLRAALSDFKGVDTPDVPKEKWPQMAMSYKLYFPDTGTKMSFALTEPSLTHNGVPRAGGIRLPDLQRPGVQKVIQIDADCGP